MLNQEQLFPDDNNFSVQWAKDVQLSVHLHVAFELVTVTEGTLRVYVEKANYNLTPGMSILIFPNQLHALESLDHTQCHLLIFSSEYVHAYSAPERKLIPKKNIFTPSAALLSDIFSLKPIDNVLKAKSILYGLVAEFDDSAEYMDRDVERNTEKDALLLKIVEYVRNNFSGDCSLNTLSQALSYHPAYISRYFVNRTGLSLTDYINRYRIGKSCYKLLESQDSITKIAFECGFNSMRSFHRNFFTQMNQTPGQYRQTALLHTKLGFIDLQK